jgi:Na+-driven multidrug efflux pump
MAAPLVVSFWMRSLFTFVDTIYASTLGDASVAAIGLSLPFEFLMIAVWVGLSTGLTSRLSRAMGAHQDAMVDQYLRAAWRMVLAVVPPFALIGLWCWPGAGWFSDDPVVARQFAIYGVVLIGGSAFSTFWSVIPDSVVKAHHDTRSTMWAGIWSNVINVVLNTIFTFVFHWGIFGIALSTVLGRFGGLAYALRKAAGHEAARKASARGAAPESPGVSPASELDPHPYRSILFLSLPAALTYALMATELTIVNQLLKRLDHATESIAAYAIQYRVLQFVLMPAIATAVAMLPYAARRFGRGDISGIRRGLKEAHFAAAAYLAIASPILLLGARPLAAMLSHSPVTADFAAFSLRLIPIACFAALPLFLCRPAFEALGRGAPGLTIALLRYVALTFPCAWIGVRIAERLGHPGFYGILAGVIGASAIASLVFLGWMARALRAVERSGLARAASPSVDPLEAEL